MRDSRLSRINDRYTKAYGTNIEGLTVCEAIEKAGFDYKVNEQPLTYMHGEKEMVDVSKKILTNSQKGNVFNVVSNRYNVVQPNEILEFYRDLTDKNGLQLKRAGVLNGGAKVFAIAAFDEAPKNKNGDIVSKNILLSTSCDGTQATKAAVYHERLVCLNGMTATDCKQFVKVTHATDFNADKVKMDLNLADNSFKLFDEIMDELIDTKIDDKISVQVIHALIGKKDDKQDESTRTKNIMKDIFNYYKNSPGSDLSTCDNTAWGLLNGFTYYVDHVQGNNANNRANSAFFGAGNKLKNDAMSILRDVARMESKAKQEIVIEQAPTNNAMELLGMQH